MPGPAKKPWYRPRNITLFLIALVVALAGREVYLALTATPGKAIDYAAKMADVIESNQPPGVPRDAPDAWPVLRDIIAREAAVEDELWPQSQRRDTSVPPLDFSILGPKLKERYDDNFTMDEVAARARQGLDAMRNAGIFESLKELSRLRRAVRPTPKGHLIDILLPDLGKARQLARMNGGRMYLAHLSGDDTEFVDAYESTLALARMMTQQATLIEHLVGLAIAALADIRLREALTERPFPAPTLEALLAAMDRQLPLRPINGVLEGERLCALDIIQWTHTDDGRGDGRLILTSLSALGWMGGSSPGTTPSGIFGTLSAWKIVNLGSIAFPGKAATTRKVNEFYDLAIRYADMPADQRLAAGNTLEDWIENRIPPRYLLLKMIVPAIGRSVSSDVQARTDIAGTRLMLAVELFNARNSRYPASLDELVPSILPELPTDPCNGRTFGYRLLDPAEDTLRRADGTPRPYLLYSFGIDGLDNKGKQAAKASVTALTRTKGVDFVFNMPRDRPQPEPAPATPDPAAQPPPEAPK